MQYVFYDKQTGRIVRTHRAVYLDAAQKPAIDLAAIHKAMAADAFILNRVIGGDAANIDVLEVPDETSLLPRRGKLMVDAAAKKLVRAPSLQLTADKRELAGDGQDATAIQVQAVDENGRTLRDLKGQVKLTTSRGRLSARGGVVNLQNGAASVRLTSVAETVDKVRVRARLLTGVGDTATLTLEFV